MRVVDRAQVGERRAAERLLVGRGAPAGGGEEERLRDLAADGHDAGARAAHRRRGRGRLGQPRRGRPASGRRRTRRTATLGRRLRSAYERATTACAFSASAGHERRHLGGDDAVQVVLERERLTASTRAAVAREHHRAAVRAVAQPVLGRAAQRRAGAAGDRDRRAQPRAGAPGRRVDDLARDPVRAPRSGTCAPRRRRTRRPLAARAREAPLSLGARARLSRTRMRAGRRGAVAAARVVVGEDEAVVAALAQRVAVRAVLGQPDAVAPAAAVDHEVVGGRARRERGRAGRCARMAARIARHQQCGRPRVAVSSSQLPRDLSPLRSALRLPRPNGRPRRPLRPERPCARRRAARRLAPVVARPRRVAARARRRRLVGVAPGAAASCRRAAPSWRRWSARSRSTRSPPSCASERWQRLLVDEGATPERVDTYALTCVGYMGNNVLPARAGDAIRMVLMAPRAQHLDAHRDRHAAGRAAARRRRARRDLRGRRLRPARRGRRRQGRDHPAGGRPGSRSPGVRRRTWPCAATSG